MRNDTEHLLSSEANSNRLLESLAQYSESIQLNEPIYDLDFILQAMYGLNADELYTVIDYASRMIDSDLG